MFRKTGTLTGVKETKLPQAGLKCVAVHRLRANLFRLGRCLNGLPVEFLGKRERVVVTQSLE